MGRVIDENEQDEPKSASALATGGKAAPTIGRIVHYRSRTGQYTVPAIVTCTVDTINPKGVEAGHLPDLTDAMHVHLTVFTPGRPGLRASADDFLEPSEHPVSENVAGCYQEWDIDYDENGEPGTWMWPPRYA